MITYTLLIALASYRLCRVVGWDTITEPMRAPLVGSDHPLAVKTLDLITCAWCLGWWVTAAVTAGVAQWQGWPWPDALLVWLSASTIVGFASRLEE